MSDREAFNGGILAGLLIAAVAVLVFIAIVTGIDRNEIVECNTWQQQAQQYPATFYLLKWQKEQCDAHHITIAASVR